MFITLWMHCRFVHSWVSAIVRTISISYSKTSNISHTNSQTYMIPVSSCNCLCPIHWNQVLNRERRCGWSSADRQCSNYIWVINKFAAYQGAKYTRGLAVIWIFTKNHRAYVDNPSWWLLSSHVIYNFWHVNFAPHTLRWKCQFD